MGIKPSSFANSSSGEGARSSCHLKGGEGKTISVEATGKTRKKDCDLLLRLCRVFRARDLRFPQGVHKIKMEPHTGSF